MMNKQENIKRPEIEPIVPIIPAKCNKLAKIAMLHKKKQHNITKNDNSAI
jgi:hypothetical protein